MEDGVIIASCDVVVFYVFFFIFREFQLMTSAANDSFLSSDQDTDRFLVFMLY